MEINIREYGGKWQKVDASKNPNSYYYSNNLTPVWEFRDPDPNCLIEGVHFGKEFVKMSLNVPSAYSHHCLHAHFVPSRYDD